MAKLPDADFIRMLEEVGPTATAKRLGVSDRSVYYRRTHLEAKIGRQITGPEHTSRTRSHIAHPERVHISVPKGVVLVGSDAHYWPGEPSTAHRAFVKFAKELAPKAIILNGDAFDGASISRHPPIGWDHNPTVQEEIEAVQDRLDEISKTKPAKCRTIWPLGNHDSRYETKIATVAPEYAKVHGTSLQDHFPTWEPCWSVWINSVEGEPGGVVVKHRFKGGMHAPQNNTLWAGKSIITAHLHSAKVMPITDYNGTRYGVDNGCLADIYGPQFLYTEDNPRNWRAGFCVLTFIGGEMLQPELVLVWDANRVEFRGELIRV